MPIVVCALRRNWRGSDREQLAQGKKPKYDNYYRDKNIGHSAKNFVVRFKNPLQGKTSFVDLIRGRIEMNNEELDDLIIARADGTPTYNLCAVVDDLKMGITHILRGDDHIVNSVRQLNIYQALAAKPPQFAHLPMIVNSNNERLSKRDGARDILDYRQEGLLPQALCSYLARLGWSYADKEIFTPAELIRFFDIKRIHSSPARFDEEKLAWVNRQFIQQSSAEELVQTVAEFLAEQNIAVTPQPPLSSIIALHKERCASLRELATDISFYYRAPAAYEKIGYEKHITAETATYISSFQQKLSTNADWSASFIKEKIDETIKTHRLGFPQLGMPLRLALCGKDSSPAIHQVAASVGG